MRVSLWLRGGRLGGEWRGTTKLERLKLAKKSTLAAASLNERMTKGREEKKGVTLFLSARKSSSLIQSIRSTMVVMLLIFLFSFE
jgi:hypothetical protein